MQSVAVFHCLKWSEKPHSMLFSASFSSSNIVYALNFCILFLICLWYNASKMSEVLHSPVIAKTDSETLASLGDVNRGYSQQVRE